jgi:hypothetical protein
MSLSWTSYPITDHEIAALITEPELRAAQRIPLRCWAKISFRTEGGRSRTITGRVVDMSASGVLVEALRPMAVGSRVRIQGNELLVGAANVRHSTRRAWRFRIGLEFDRAVQNRY